MLNISPNSIKDHMSWESFSAFQSLEKKSISTILLKMILGFFVVAFLCMFLPWTQNIRSKGYVTTLNPDDRPQGIQSLIDGRIDQWYIKEGDQVKVGDTILKVTETKGEYLDPQLLQRVQGQITAKNESSKAYLQKSKNLESQYDALIQSAEIKRQQNELKITQVRNKLIADSLDLVAARLKLKNYTLQLDRTQELFSKGIKSRTDLEKKQINAQEAQAKVLSIQNKILNLRNDISVFVANRAAIENEYQNKIFKSQSEKMSALSDMYGADASVEKLQSDYNKYNVRQDNYIVRSPIDGLITRNVKSGIGSMIKAGEELVKIVPNQFDIAIEIYASPMDMPLIKIGQRVNIQFDGWPAIVFSGWPNSTYGTFEGRVTAMDNYISDNGKYRLLVGPSNPDEPWPEEVRLGGGANALILLNNVQVYYEIWRQLNGFPPDYYESGQTKSDLKTKAPIRKIK